MDGEGDRIRSKIFVKTFQANEAIFDEDFVLVEGKGRKVDHYTPL